MSRATVEARQQQDAEHWAWLTETEPRLVTLEAGVKAIPRPLPGKHFCANAWWYGYEPRPGIKPRLVTLVGFTAEGPLRRRDVGDMIHDYDVAYEHLYQLLPDCHDCTCA